VKIDPYINVDAGTMNPLEHGEIFVTDDGTESDQDLGNYERFLDRSFSRVNYMTTGRVYDSVIRRERNLEYKGKCVEVVPHIPLEVISRIQKAGKADKADFVLIEIGGTVGEYQNMLFLEAARMMKVKNPKEVLFLLVSYLPVPPNIGEMKTKPTQTAVRTLNAAGIRPDMIIARSVVPVDKPRKEKLSVFCDVKTEDVISAPDVSSIYEIPVNFEKENLGGKILSKFGLKTRRRDMKEWKKLVRQIHSLKKPVRIGIVGKYFEVGDFALMDSYLSVIEAIKHASWAEKRAPEITWLSAEKYEKNPKAVQELKAFDGIIVPGGFGSRGVEGKIKAIEFVRKNRIPFLGLCLGLQLAVIEFARHVAGMKEATSSEFSGKGDLVINVMEEQEGLIKEKKYGGTMRLGAYRCRVKKGTKAYAAYGKTEVSERHRHRYEISNRYKEKLEKKGMVFSGTNPERDLVEIGELPSHPFFLGTQFHPELKSRPLGPHPLFQEFLKAAIRR
ncbi:MAG: CTP synthase, partial [bacterium]|nr:CTP synthase [bacterium]